jgi:ATP-dependent Clp protease ATP-binding subunit ClpB
MRTSNSKSSLQREKDSSSKERLAFAKREIAAIDDKLRPLKAAFENEKKRGDEINQLRRRIDELKAKADDAERRYILIIHRSGLC